MEKTMPLREVRNSLGQRVDAAHYADEHTVITKNGQPRAVILSYETYRDMADKIEQLTIYSPQTTHENTPTSRIHEATASANHEKQA